MASITEIKARIEDFLSKELNKDPGSARIIEVSKSDEGWLARVQVAEENLFIKKLGYPPVYDTNVYKITIDEQLNFLSYRQEGTRQEAERERV